MKASSVVPFTMYPDEHILWKESRKGYFSKKAIRINVWIASIIFALIFIFTFLNGHFKRENTVVFSITIICYFILFFYILFIIVYTATHIEQKRITYYITNFRIIRYHALKNPLFYFDFISNIADMYIIESKDNDRTIEFTWKEEHPNHESIYCFENIDNIDKIYDIILSQRENYDDIEETIFDTMVFDITQ